MKCSIDEMIFRQARKRRRRILEVVCQEALTQPHGKSAVKTAFQAMNTGSKVIYCIMLARMRLTV